jgi:imidazolonepropionase-like amidohydrolase
MQLPNEISQIILLCEFVWEYQVERSCVKEIGRKERSNVFLRYMVWFSIFPREDKSMIRQSIVWIVLVAAFVIPAQAQVVVLEGGTLIDGTGKSPISNAVVVIEGSRIKAAGAKGQVTYPQNARIIKTDGKFILPGLIDSHIHLKDYMAPMFLRYGVTAVGDTNNHTEWSVQQRDALKAGKIKGPRLFISGVAAGGSAEGVSGATIPSKTEPFAPYTRPGSDRSPVFAVELKTVDEARAYARSLIARHVDVIKVDLNLTLDQLRAIIEEANKAGIPVVGHSQNIRKAAEVGLKYMEHTDTLGRAILEEMGGPQKVKEGGANPERLMDTKLFDGLIQFMVKQGVYLNPTMVARWRTSTPRGQEMTKAAIELNKEPALAFVPAGVRESWTVTAERPGDAEAYRKVAEFLRKYAEAGGKVLAATDAGMLPGLSLHYEMQMLVDAGIPPMKAIQGTTLWAAESIGQQKDLGSIEPGKLADITVVDGNPLNDIAATRKVGMVIKDGKVLDTTYDRGFKNPIPRPTR